MRIHPRTDVEVNQTLRDNSIIPIGRPRGIIVNLEASTAGITGSNITLQGGCFWDATHIVIDFGQRPKSTARKTLSVCTVYAQLGESEQRTEGYTLRAIKTSTQTGVAGGGDFLLCDYGYEVIPRLT